MAGGRGTNRRLTGAALAGIVALAAVVGLLLSARRPNPTPSPSPSAAPSATADQCLGVASPAPAVPVALPTPSPAAPVSAGGYSLVDDPATRQVVLFGGIDDYGSTWLWDGQRWTRAQPSPSPPGRFLAAAAYDPVTRQVMLYGGRLGGGEVVCDTWAWTGSTWLELDPGNRQLPPGDGARMEWDGSDQEMFLVAWSGTGLETWVWNQGWVRQPGGDVPGDWVGGLGFDPASRSLLLVALSGPGLAAASTWRWDGAAWRQLEAPPCCVTVSAGGMSLDPLGDRLVVLVAPGGLWSWGGTGWRPLPGSRVPAVDAMVIATDVAHGRLLLVGSTLSTTQQAPQPLHVWAWTGSGWKRLA